MPAQDRDVEKGVAQAEAEPSTDNIASQKEPKLDEPGNSSGPNLTQYRDVEKEAGAHVDVPDPVNNTSKKEAIRNNPGDPSVPNRPNAGAVEGTKSSDFDHPTSKIWAVFNSEAGPFDKALIESWTKDMDGILIFAGLFSAVVSAFLIDVYHNLSQDSGDATVALLAHISLQLAAVANNSQIGPISPPNDFQPTNSTISVIILCNGLAITNRLLSIDPHHTPRDSLIRSFLFDGVEKFKMTAVVEGIPTLLHFSVLLFILGLIQFLFSVNLVVAGVILGIFLMFVLLYFGVTVLPTISAQCPYRTPFSTLVRYFIIWGMELIYKLLFKIWCWTPYDSLLKRWTDAWTDKLAAIIPDYNWAATRESAAEDLSSESAKRRVDKSLRWTLDSLTTDSELEPFVAGLPALLMISPDQSKSQMVSDAMIAILFDPYGPGSASRIARLLHTCIPPTILSDEPRIKRATICLHAVDAICNTKSLDKDRSLLKLAALLEEGEFSTALSSLARLGSHNELASSAAALNSFLATNLEAALHNGAVAEDRELSAVSRIFYSVGRFQSLRLLVKNEKDTSFLLDLFTDWTTEYSQQNSKPSVSQQRFVVECLIINSRATLQAYQVVFTPLPLMNSLVKFRGDKQLAIAQCANCASVSWAVPLQCNLLWNMSAYQSNIVEALTVFGTVVLEDHQVLGSIVVNGEFSLGIQFRDNKPGTVITEYQWGRLKEQWMLKFSPSLSDDASVEVDHSVQYDQARLDALRMVDEDGHPLEAGHWGRVVISRGRTAILVVFLSSMKTFPPPEETLELTLETLHLVTASLTASYSSASTQTALIKLVARTFKQFHAHLMLRDTSADPLEDQGAQKDKEEGDPVDAIGEIPLGASDVGPSPSGVDLSPTEKYILPMLRALLDVVGTIAHPDSIDEAKKVVKKIRDDFTGDKFPAVFNDAVEVLKKLDGRHAFAFDEKLLPTPSSGEGS